MLHTQNESSVLVSRILLGASAILLFSDLAYGEGWPQRQRSGRNGISTEQGLPREWPEVGPAPGSVVHGIGQGFLCRAVVGRFEFSVGPGTYVIAGPRNADRTVFKIDGQKSFEVKLHACGSDSVRISGRVVSRENPKHGVAGVKVVGVSVKHGQRSRAAISDNNGRFKIVGNGTEMYLHAETLDRHLAGIVKVQASQSSVELPVGPTGMIHARLLEEVSREPLPNRQIEYGVFLGEELPSPFGGVAITDGDGRFNANGLVFGRQYVLKVVMGKTSNGRPNSWRRLKLFSPENTPVDLGDVVLRSTGPNAKP